MAQPSSKINWIPSDDPTKIVAPSTSKKNTGWTAEEKPPFQFFNWFWNLLSYWVHWLQGCNAYNIIVSSDTDEQDYASLEAYIADAPVAGDRIIIKNDQTITAQITIPDDIEITLLKGAKFTCAVNIASVLEFGSNVKIKGTLLLETNQAGTITEAITFNGDNCHCDNIHINNTGTGTITTAFIIKAAKNGNFCRGLTEKTGGGAITNPLTDSSGTTTNDVIIRGV